HSPRKGDVSTLDVEPNEDPQKVAVRPAAEAAQEFAQARSRSLVEENADVLGLVGRGSPLVVWDLEEGIGTLERGLDVGEIMKLPAVGTLDGGHERSSVA